MTGETWDENASEWAKRLAAGSDLSREHLVLPAIAELFARTGASNVLDAGCGSGGTGRMLRHLHGVDVVGVDSSLSMCREATAASGGAIAIIHGDVTSLPLQSSMFDAVVANLVLQSVEDLGRCFAEFARVLRPEGVVIFSLLHPARVSPEPIPEAAGAEPSVLASIWPVREYAHERRMHVRIRLGGPDWLPAPVTYYHRKLATYVAALRAAAFVLIDLREPIADDAVMTAHPHMADFWRLVPFLVCMAQKQI